MSSPPRRRHFSRRRFSVPLSISTAVARLPSWPTASSGHDNRNHDREGMMKFLCLAYEEEQKLSNLSQSEWDALRGETLAYVEVLRKGGHLIATHALQSVRTAATVRVRQDGLSVMDGPFAETKETLGGFFLIEAADRAEAIALASRWPSARLGSIEVRPIEEELRVDRRY
ncbi:MAG TPA: YciI family protein [Candidatus Dormibacteraeota bacterium]|nr:YciI family protein [Candidatus Dormibacteraeota bacterium]